MKRSRCQSAASGKRFLMLCVTSLVTTASHRIGWQIPLLVLPTMYGVNKSYRLYFGRAEALARPIASAKAAGAK